jgi:hypothetical protein
MSLLQRLYNANAPALEPYVYDETEVLVYSATDKPEEIVFRKDGQDIFKHVITYDGSDRVLNIKRIDLI